MFRTITQFFRRVWARFRITAVGPKRFSAGPDVADQPFGPQPQQRRPRASHRPSRRTQRRRTGGWGGAVAQ